MHARPAVPRRAVLPLPRSLPHRQGGVVKVLAEAGIITADTPLSGNSGGALASIGIVIGALHIILEGAGAGGAVLAVPAAA